ncbi:hypothetical protein B0H11DRAFT_2232981 [Mycena galericulata]|nr:hypothetical protein B0H11DRAFT_2232981 [Mycena galericulata]
MNVADAPWRIKTRPCPFYQQGRCVFEQSCNFVHDISVTTASSSSSRLPELLDALGDVLDPPDTISLVSEHGTSPHISGEGWTLVNDTSITKDSLLSPVSLPDLQLSRFSTLKNDSFDSGYGSEWSSPQPLPSTLNLLASPFGSPSSRMGASRLFTRSPFSPGFSSPMSNRDDSPELDSPSKNRVSTAAVMLGQEGNDDEDDEDDDAQYTTAQWHVSPDTTLDEPQQTSRFSTSTLALTEDSYSDSDSGSDGEGQEDSTAHLAYLSSSPTTTQTFPLEENDTINTLYDVYLHSPPQPALPSDAEDRGRIRAPVFTPAPTERKFNPRESSTPPRSRRSESRNEFPSSVFSDSPESVPPRSLSSMSNRGRNSPADPSAQPITASPISSMPNGGKVPFGFRSESRNSRRSVGPASASALQTTFSRAPNSPRKRRISRSVAPQSASALRTSFYEPEPPLLSSPPPTVKGLKHLRLSSTVLVPPPSAFTFNDQTSSNSHVSRRASTVHSASASFSVPSSHLPPIPTNTHTTQDNDTIRPEHDLDRPLWSAPLQRRGWQNAPDDDDDGGKQDEEQQDEDDPNYTIRRRIPPAPIHIPQAGAASPTRAASALGFTHAATPRPTLLFAIASDDPEAVRRVLESGEAQATDSAGPEGQSALQFTLANKQLTKRLEIARVLLAFGAQGGEEEEEQVPGTIDPAMKYYVQRAGEEHARRSSALIHRSFFRPLARVRYEIVGQDRALEQLFRVLSIHSQQLAVLPVVVLLCGPSGHGKSLLARKFGALLDVPTHTVNMTTLRSAHDLWQAYSMSPYEEPTTFTLAEFLINNEGKRCVVVLDEIEKVEEKTLWPLLMPWESGRCSFEANSRHIDVRNVVWLGTSNIGHDVVSEHHSSRARPDELMSREEYVQLMNMVREPVSKHMGASVLSRVTTVLPFVPFTRDEQTAICAEAFHALAGEMVTQLPPDDRDKLICAALLSYVPAEGARSLYRAVSNQLVDL